MTTLSSEIFRIDPLTGCKNYLAFVEALANSTAQDHTGRLGLPEVVERVPWTGSLQESSILFLDLCSLKSLNESKGHLYGDSVIRWMGILLGEESNSPAFRLGGGNYALLLTTGTHPDHLSLLERMLERIDREARSFGITPPAVHVALIQYANSPTSPDHILMQMGEAMIRVKFSREHNFKVFKTTDLNISARMLADGEIGKASEVFYSMRWISRGNVYHVMALGRMLDQIQQEAYTDAISGLPNMRAALLELENQLDDAGRTGDRFSVLLIDGDNIHAYNNINYAAGDVMIRDMSTVFRQNLRPHDFVARWRSGDEFLAILPDTSAHGAKLVGERFRLAVKHASQNWRFRTTISIGIATFPQDGSTVNDLVEKAENALKKAKESGKDQVTLAG